MHLLGTRRGAGGGAIAPLNRPGDTLAVVVDGVERAVRVRDDGPGDAPAVLIVHGFTGSSDWWDPVANRLSATHRVLRFDLLGHGLTGGRSADAPGQTVVAAAVLDHTGVRDVTVVGHSFGADVAAALAGQDARVTRVMLVCQAPDYTAATLPRGSSLMARPLLGRGLLDAGKLIARGLGAAAGLLGRPADPATRRLVDIGVADFRAVDPQMFRIVIADRAARLARHPLDAQLRAAGKPAFVVLGGKDGFYGDRSASRYRQAGARVEVVPDAGHSIQYERPDEVARLIASFAAGG